MLKKLIPFLLCTVSFGQTALTINTTLTPAHSTVYRVAPQLGIPNGPNDVQLKNLLWNVTAGFEGNEAQLFGIQYIAGSTTTFTLSNASPSVALTPNKYQNALYEIVENYTTPTANYRCKGTITASSSGGSGVLPTVTLGNAQCPTGFTNGIFPTGYAAAAPLSLATANGDQIVVDLQNDPLIPNPGFGWQVTAGSPVIYFDRTTQYDGSQSWGLDTTPAGSSITGKFSVLDGLGENPVMLNQTYTMSIMAKLVSGTPNVVYKVQKGSQVCSLTVNSSNLTTTGVWTPLSTSCVMTEAPSAGLQTLNWSWTQANGANIELDDPVFIPTTGQLTANHSIFRDEVWTGMRGLCGSTGPLCSQRNWTWQNGQRVANWFLPMQQAAITYAGTFIQGGSQATQIPLFDWLEFVEETHGFPDFVVPITLLPEDAQLLITYLTVFQSQFCTATVTLPSGGTIANYRAGTDYCTKGKPWVSTTAGAGLFPVVNMEFSNEPWNTSGQTTQDAPSRGGTPTRGTDIAQRTGTIFKAMRLTSTFTPLIKLFYAAQAANTTGVATELANMQARGGQADGAQIATYVNTATSCTTASCTEAQLWTPVLGGPYADTMMSTATQPSYNGYQPSLTNIATQNSCGPSGTAACIPVVYEMSMSPNLVDQATSDAFNAGYGTALVASQQIMYQIQAGYGNQNDFASLGYQGSGSPASRLYGHWVGCGSAMSTTNGVACQEEPWLMGIHVADAAIIGQHVNCTPSTTDPLNWAGGFPTPPNTTLPRIEATCFIDGAGNYAVHLTNWDAATSYTVSMAGSALPSGSYAITDLKNTAGSGSLNTLATPATGTYPGTSTANYGVTTSTASSYTLAPNSTATLVFAMAGNGSPSINLGAGTINLGAGSWH